jgi:transposase InsO family protein
VRYEKLERSFVVLNRLAAAIITFRKVPARINLRINSKNWCRHYNEIRPHSSLGYMTPQQATTTAGIGLSTQAHLQIAVA